MPPSEIHVKRSESNEVEMFRGNNEFVIQYRMGEILQEGQPLPPAVYKAGGDFMR